MVLSILYEGIGHWRPQQNFSLEKEVERISGKILWNLVPVYIQNFFTVTALQLKKPECSCTVLDTKRLRTWRFGLFVIIRQVKCSKSLLYLILQSISNSPLAFLGPEHRATLQALYLHETANNKISKHNSHKCLL